ncbi:hypothetical protein F2Q70_00002503 [Brassica cretica]|uniref:Uncharacterized protein n=1 Tax=Brassica cretica TaxID=69181 RepID=A0A8S9IPS8_BRACR|nr:hypothetical protein F2Q70_00002503 [Brassica cretica]
MNAPTHQLEGTSKRSIRSKNPNSEDKRLPSIDTPVSTSNDSHSKPKLSLSTKNMSIDYNFLLPDEFGIFRDQDGHARAMDGRILQVSREDIAYIVQLVNGVDNLFTQQSNILDNNPTVPDEYQRATTSGIGSHQSCTPVGQASIDKVVSTSLDRLWSQKVTNGNKKTNMESTETSLDMQEVQLNMPLPFTPTNLTPEIYIKDEINEMVIGICGAPEQLGDEVKTLVDETYQPLDRGYNELFRCMAELKTEIETTSIDICNITSIDTRFAAMEDRTLVSIMINITDRPRSTDQYMEPNQPGDQNVLNISTEVHVFHRTGQTDRAVYWTVPHTSGKELWLEPWPDDRSDHTGA